MAGRPDRESLAWAAGLFDGEGHTGSGRGCGFIEVSQSGEKGVPEVLTRFKDVFGFGKIDGPYYHSRKVPIYRYRLGSFEHVQAVIAMMWPWLGSVKRAQAVKNMPNRRKKRGWNKGMTKVGGQWVASIK